MPKEIKPFGFGLVVFLFLLQSFFGLQPSSSFSFNQEFEEDVFEPKILSKISDSGERLFFYDPFRNWRQILAKETRQRAENVRGIYLTNPVASGRNSLMLELRNKAKEILEETEVNSVVIDVKEVKGLELSQALKEFVEDLKQKNYWTIARIVAFRDCSQVKEHSDWYLKDSQGNIWKDKGGGCWLDPANEEVQEYLINVSKEVIDFGFDELQFDYWRYPSDPFYPTDFPKYKVIRDFSERISQELKNYEPRIVLSVDVFGYVATSFHAREIGQRLEDLAPYFDYLSFMLYPSHFYAGFSYKNVYFPYESEDTSSVVSNRPFEVVYYSIISAREYLQELGLETKIRPWLQGFDLKIDTQRGIFYGPEKVRLQIRAAREAGASGWLIWNPANIYRKGDFLE